MIPPRLLTSRPDDDYSERPCLGAHAVYDAVLDHPVGGPNSRAVDAAKAICATCPLEVLTRCLRDNHDEPGVIAGLTHRERVKRLPPTDRVGCGTPHGNSVHYRANEQPCEPCRVAHNAKHRERKQTYDEARVHRRMTGERVRVNAAEASEVIRRMFAAGMSLATIRKITGLKPERYTKIDELRSA